ncbi:MAG TPA: gephyrin-like molybdotransferase Glp [Candidatus Bathyarchaeia archaeon]|nr:gephyrin-like molybdotransferase Glp [Candidatus Bathyarchaeia archaeon]
MISFEEAYRIVMESARLLGSEHVSLPESLHRVLAEDVASDMDMPPFNKSAMDGYACRRHDLPRPLRVVEIIQAGYTPTQPIDAGCCAKIMTGAQVPEGADCVVMVEYTEVLDDGGVCFTGEDTAANICTRGEDIRAGDVVLRAGTLVEPQHIAVLATVGCVKPRVSKCPRVGIVATGDELVEPEVCPGPSQIRTSNSYQLCAQTVRAGSVPTYYGIVRDTEADIGAAMKRAMVANDVIIMSGGVSMGDYDLVPSVMRGNGFDILFDSVAVKPGKPTTFAVSRSGSRSRAHWCFGLPGNPVSTFIQFEILIKPFLYRLMGHDYQPAYQVVPLTKTIHRRKTDRETWIPVRTDGRGASACEFHGSAHLNALTEATGFVVMPADVAELKEGVLVHVRSI